MNRCTKCILPASYPGIEFDDAGLCNYCHAYTPTDCRGGKALLEVIDRYRDDNNSYDCIVGLSGGRDSSYLLYYATEVLNLRVLAYTYDNGFMPAETQSNIASMTQRLNVEHIIETKHYTKRCLNHVLSSWTESPSPGMISSLCVGCRMGMVLGFLKAAREHQVPLLLTGGGEPESSFATLFLTSGQDRNRPMWAGYLAEMAANPRYALNPRFVATAFSEYACYFVGFRLAKRIVYPDQKYVPIFRYVEWDEDTILSVIREKLDWQNYAASNTTWRSDCKIALLKNYLYAKTVGFTKNDELLSNLIRDGAITRETAIERVNSENQFPEDFVSEFCAEIGVDYRKLKKALRAIETTIAPNDEETIRVGGNPG